MFVHSFPRQFNGSSFYNGIEVPLDFLEVLLEVFPLFLFEFPPDFPLEVPHNNL